MKELILIINQLNLLPHIVMRLVGSKDTKMIEATSTSILNHITSYMVKYYSSIRKPRVALLE